MSNWLDVSANKLRQTYLQGFLDISGGSIKLRNDMSMNFYDNTGSNVPKFSIKSDSLRITNASGTGYDMSLSKLLHLLNVSGDINSDITDLVNRTKYITSDSSDNNTILELDGSDSNKNIKVHGNIVPGIANFYNLGTPEMPFGSIYVNNSTIHFIDRETKQTSASISYDKEVGSLDLSINGFKSSLNNITLKNGVLREPLLKKNNKIGIGVEIPQYDLDVSGTVNIVGDSSFNGNLKVNGNMIINNDLSVNGLIRGSFPNFSIPSSAISDLQNNGKVDILFQNSETVTYDDELFGLTANTEGYDYIKTIYPNNTDLSLSLIGNLYVNGGGKSIFKHDVDINSTLTVNNETIQGNLYVGQNVVLSKDVSMNNNLDLSGSLIARNNLNVYGIINQYTSNNENGYKISYDQNQTIHSLQQQVNTLQNQINNILQILNNNNIQ